MDILQVFESQITVVLLLLVRTGAIVFSAPVFGSASIPPLLKVGATVLLVLALLPVIQQPALTAVDSLLGYSLHVVREIFIGLIIGFVTSLLMNSFFIAGQAVDTQMGLGVMNVIDPLSKVHTPIIGQIKFLIAVMIFLSLDGPYKVIQALLWSYEMLPISELTLPNFGRGILRLSVDMWLIAIKIAAPVMAAVLLTHIGLGMVAKTVPQMNVFLVGFTLTISVGLITVYASLTWFRPLTEDLFDQLFEQIGFLLQSDNQ